MIGVSLPYPWLVRGGSPYGDRTKMLERLREAGVSSVELRTVRPGTDPNEVKKAADLLWDAGFQITVHGDAAPLPSRAAEPPGDEPLDEAFAAKTFEPLALVLEYLRQPRLIVTIHPKMSRNDEMLAAFDRCVRAHDLPVVIALENSRLMPDKKTEGDCASLVAEAVGKVKSDKIGVCFDMGHYRYYRLKNTPDTPDQPPSRAFCSRIVHTHIHALNLMKTHHPLEAFDLPLDDYLGAFADGYDGVFNLELEPERFKDTLDPADALIGSVRVLREAVRKAAPLTAAMFDDVRESFDRRFLAGLEELKKPERGEKTSFLLAASSSYLINTRGTLWGMDLAFRKIWDLAESPRRAAELLSDLSFMLISHGHEDHFEEKTVRALAGNPMKWVVPDFLIGQAKRCGLKEEQIVPAGLGEKLTICGVTIEPIPAKHFRPDGNGVPEYGYLVSAPGAPTLAFPGDTRDYSTNDVPEYRADVCFAPLWLGDHIGDRAPEPEKLAAFAGYMTRYSEKAVFITHLWETGRVGKDLWRDEHAAAAGQFLREASEHVVSVKPEPGVVYELDTFASRPV